MPIEPDTISSPTHYTWRGGIEPIRFITTNGLSFLEGNIIKLLYRWPKKGRLEDLLKARFYINQMIKAERGRKK